MRIKAIQLVGPWLKSLRDKLQTSLPKVKSCSTFRNDFSYKIQVAGAIAPCNTPFATCLAMALRDKLHKKLPRVTSALCLLDYISPTATISADLRLHF